MTGYQEPTGGYSRKPVLNRMGHPISNTDVVHMDPVEAVTVNAPGQFSDDAAAHRAETLAWIQEVASRNVHSTQGQTVDTAHTVIAERAAPETAYVAMTRGRESDTASRTEPSAHVHNALSNQAATTTAAEYVGAAEWDADPNAYHYAEAEPDGESHEM